MGRRRPLIRYIRKDFGPLMVQLFFLKIDTEGDKTRSSRNLFQYLKRELRRHRSCIEDGLVLAIIGRCALLARLGVGGGKSQTGLDQLHL